MKPIREYRSSIDDFAHVALLLATTALLAAGPLSELPASSTAQPSALASLAPPPSAPSRHEVRS